MKKEFKNYCLMFFSNFENWNLQNCSWRIVYLHWIWTIINVSWQLIEIFRLIQIFPKNWADPKYAKYGVFDSCHQQVARRIQYSGFRCNTVASNRRRRITSNFILSQLSNPKIILNFWIFHRVPEKVLSSNL